MPVGQYVADFACLEARPIVEIDGSQHAGAARDETRTAELRSRGFRVLRSWNDQVLRERESACDTIMAFARDQSLRPWR